MTDLSRMVQKVWSIGHRLPQSPYNDLTFYENIQDFGTLAWRYSKIKGRSQGKYIHTCLDYDHCQVHLVCTTYEEYEKERNKLLPIKWWKAMIAKKA